MWKCCTLLVLSLIALLHAAPGCVLRKGSESPDDPAALARQPIVVRLIIPDEVFDPDNPSDNVIRCVVRNNTKDQVRLVQPYDGETVCLFARSQEQPRMLLKDRSFSIRTVSLEAVAPGEEKAVFEMPLKEILLSTDESSLWEWTSPTQTTDGVSPIGDMGVWQSATFWVVLRNNEQTLQSNRVTLRVKGDLGASEAPPGGLRSAVRR